MPPYCKSKLSKIVSSESDLNFSIFNSVEFEVLILFKASKISSWFLIIELRS